MGQPTTFYPIADEWFPTIKLQDEHITKCHRLADSMMKDAMTQLALYQQHSPQNPYFVHSDPWKLHANVEKLQAFKRRHATRQTTSLVQILGEIHGNYRDLTRFFAFGDIRSEYFNVEKRLFPCTVDANVLLKLTPQATDRLSTPHSTAIKWVVYAPISSKCRMDCCFFECCGTTNTSDGQNVGYRITIPIQLPEWPEMYKTKRTLRIYSNSVMLFVPSQTQPKALTQIFFSSQNDFRTNYIPRSVYKRYMISLHNLGLALEAKTANPQVMDSEFMTLKKNEQWVVKESPKECRVCSKKFTLLRSSRLCTSCSAPVCRKCVDSIVPGFAVPELTSFGTIIQPPKVEVCANCLTGLLDDQQAARDARTSSVDLHRPSTSQYGDSESRSDVIGATDRPRRESGGNNQRPSGSSSSTSSSAVAHGRENFHISRHNTLESDAETVISMLNKPSMLGSSTASSNLDPSKSSRGRSSQGKMFYSIGSAKDQSFASTRDSEDSYLAGGIGNRSSVDTIYSIQRKGQNSFLDDDQIEESYEDYMHAQSNGHANTHVYYHDSDPEISNHERRESEVPSAIVAKPRRRRHNSNDEIQNAYRIEQNIQDQRDIIMALATGLARGR